MPVRNSSQWHKTIRQNDDHKASKISVICSLNTSHRVLVLGLLWQTTGVVCVSSLAVRDLLQPWCVVVSHTCLQAETRVQRNQTMTAVISADSQRRANGCPSQLCRVKCFHRYSVIPPQTTGYAALNWTFFFHFCLLFLLSINHNSPLLKYLSAAHIKLENNLISVIQHLIVTERLVKIRKSCCCCSG